MHVERHVHIPTTKKPILMVCSRTTRPHTPSKLPLPALCPLPAGCSPWPNTPSFLPFSQGHLIHHCCWHERGSHFALPIHQESMGFIWCLILKMWFDLLGDRLTHLSQTMMSQHALSEKRHKSQSYISRLTVGYRPACHWLWQHRAASGSVLGSEGGRGGLGCWGRVGWVVKPWLTTLWGIKRRLLLVGYHPNLKNQLPNILCPGASSMNPFLFKQHRVDSVVSSQDSW